MSKIIAVWGSPGSGKLTLSAQLAKALTKKGAQVILVGNDSLTPILPLLFSDIQQGCSLGQLLASVQITQEEILKNLVTGKRSPNLGALGYNQGENAKTYADYTYEKATDLLIQLRHIADYIVVCCTRETAGNILTTASLLQADSVLQLGTCDPKSIAFFASQRALLQDEAFRIGRFIKVLTLSSPDVMQAVNEGKDAMGGIRHTIPYSLALKQLYDSGRLLEAPSDDKYMKALQALMREVQ